MTKKPTVGAVFGDWVITGEALGKGGNARVFPAERRDKSRSGAIKLLWRTTDEAVARFRQEIRTVCRLEQHPHLVEVLDVSRETETGEGDSLWYVMEYVAGGTLEDNRQKFESRLRESLQLIQQCAEGVAFLHESRVIHRDIKPDNILLRPEGSSVISDLGLCWLIDFKSEARMTPEGRPTGAWGFRAPEHEHRRPEDVDVSADIFSLVKILWWLIDGGPPFASAHHDSEEFDLVKKYAEPAMYPVMQLVRRAVRFKPDEREPRTARLLATELTAIIKKLDSTPPKVAHLAAEYVNREKRLHQFIRERSERDKAIGLAAPAMFHRWREVLKALVAEANETIREQGGTREFALIANENKGCPTQIGFLLDRVGVALVIQPATRLEDSAMVISSVALAEVFDEHGRITIRQRPPAKELTLECVGGTIFLLDPTDETRTPLDPERYWCSLIGQALGGR